MRSVADKSVTIFTRPVSSYPEPPDATLGDGAESRRSHQRDDAGDRVCSHQRRSHIAADRSGHLARGGHQVREVERASEIGMQHRDRDVTVALWIMPEVHVGHAASAEFALAGAAASEGGCEAVWLEITAEKPASAAPILSGRPIRG